MTRPDIDRMAELADAATEGPWQLSYLEEGIAEVETPDGTHIAVADGRAADADFIAAARTFIPEVIAYVRELEENLRLSAIAIDRLANDSGRRHPLAEVMARLEATDDRP